MANLEQLFKNTSKLVKKIEEDLDAIEQKRISTLVKGVASELTAQLKGKSLDDITSLATMHTYAPNKNLRFNDIEILRMKGDTSGFKIKKVEWTGEWDPDGRGNHSCDLEVFYVGPNGRNSIIFPMEFKIVL